MLSPEDVKNLFQIFKSGSIENIEIAIQISESSNIDLYLNHFEELYAYLVKMKIFSQEENISISKKVYNILNLETLKLYITETADTIIPANIYLLKKLKKFCIEATIEVWIPSTLPYFEQLEELEMQLFNQEKLPNCIFEIITLKKLDLSMNLFHELPRSIWQLRNLEYLNLCYCLNLEKIPNELFGLPKLETVFLFFTSIDEISPSIVYSNINKYTVDINHESKPLIANIDFGKRLLRNSVGTKFGDLFKEKMQSKGLTRSKVKNVPENIRNQGLEAVKQFLKRS